MHSEIKRKNGIPALCVDDHPISQMAYITYRTDNNRYNDFAKAGVKLYSVNLNFSEMPINERAPVLVFQKGIFEKDTPNFDIVDKNFGEIFDANPDAYIFPRVNVNLSEEWEKNHPGELCERSFNERKRVCFSSDIWADEVKKNLKLLIEYIEKQPYADRIIGYQIAGGNTEEWFPLDGFCSYGKRSIEKFLEFCKNNNLEKNEENYYTFASDIVAQRIVEFSRVAKEMVNYKKIVGAFYGYTINCAARNTCQHALDKILESKEVDFLCSPITYSHSRAPGLDPYPAVPVDSLKVHNKLYFSENDIRTHLSYPVHDHPNYTLPIWYGPEKKITLEQLKLSFCRAFLHGYGMWWFDMWGGWYDDKDYMALMGKMSEICKNGMDKPSLDVAVFIDEKSYCKTDKGITFTWKTINNLGLTSTSYDVYLASDFDAVYKNYKACIIFEPEKTDLTEQCIKKATDYGIALKVIRYDDGEISTEDLRSFLKRANVKMYTEQNSVVYNGEKYISLYTCEDGEYGFEINGKTTFTDLFTNKAITFPTKLEKYKCYLFEK